MGWISPTLRVLIFTQLEFTIGNSKLPNGECRRGKSRDSGTPLLDYKQRAREARELAAPNILHAKLVLEQLY